MSLLDPIKKLLFGVKGVTKHQAEQAAEYTKEKGEELFDKTIDMMKDAGQILGKTGAKVLDKVDDLWDKKPETASTDKITEAKPTFSSSPDFVEPIKDKMEKFGEKAADALGKMKETAKEVGGKVAEASDDFWKKAEDFSENVVEKARTKGSELFEKAKQVAEEKSKELNQKIDEFIEKEKAIEAKEPKGDFADTPITENKNLTEPLMKKHEDFFDKAKKFLDEAEKKQSKPVQVESKKVVASTSTNASAPSATPEKPLDPNAQKQLNDLLSASPASDQIEDADIVEDVTPPPAV